MVPNSLYLGARCVPGTLPMWLRMRRKGGRYGVSAEFGPQRFVPGADGAFPPELLSFARERHFSVRIQHKTI